MNIEPIAHFRSPLREKFGVPRQSGVVAELRGEVVFEPKYAVAEALRGLEGFDYVWLLWGFHRARRNDGGSRQSDASGMSGNDMSGQPASSGQPAPFHPTVRPPRLGGNERMGVFATRSPFRPNGLGLSSVRLGRIGVGRLEVLGADLMDGTPIYDVKPYLPAADSHPEARGGFAERAWQPLSVDIPPQLAATLDAATLAALRGVLAQDPRPHYQHDPERVYGMAFGQHNVRFRVDGTRLTVVSL